MIITIKLSIDNEEDILNRVLQENTLTVIAKEITLMSKEEVTIRLGTPFYGVENISPKQSCQLRYNWMKEIKLVKCLNL